MILVGLIHCVINGRHHGAEVNGTNKTPSVKTKFFIVFCSQTRSKHCRKIKFTSNQNNLQSSRAWNSETSWGEKRTVKDCCLPAFIFPLGGDIENGCPESLSTTRDGTDDSAALLETGIAGNCSVNCAEKMADLGKTQLKQHWQSGV